MPGYRRGVSGAGEGRLRIAPELIVGSVWTESRVGTRAAKGMLGLGAGLVEAVLFLPLASWWAVPVGVAVGATAGWFANGSTLLRMWALRKGKDGAAAQRKPEISIRRPAGEITAGMWVCPSSVIAGQERQHDQLIKRRQREFENKDAEWLRRARMNRQEEEAGNEPVEALPPRPVRPPDPPPPKGTFKQVVAVKRTGEQVDIAWRGRGRGTDKAHRDEQYNCVDREETPRLDPGRRAAAVALRELMRMFPEDRDERELITVLEKTGHSPGAARQALRGALAWGLLEMTGHTPGHRAQELVALFHKPDSPQPVRRVTVTPAGEVWAFADARAPA